VLGELSDGRLIVTQVLPDTPGAEAGIETGAEILAWDGQPVDEAISRVNPYLGSYTFPLVHKGLEIVGKFGWSTCPKPVKEASLLQSERIFKRKDAIFGVVGSADMGQAQVIPALDPDVKMFLRPYIRMVY